MKSIRIGTDGTVSVVSHENEITLADIYNAIGCEMFQHGTFLKNGDIVLVDEEGMMRSNGRCFLINSQLFYGNGLVVGTDGDGEFVSPKSTLDEILAITTDAFGNKMKENFILSKQMRVIDTRPPTITKMTVTHTGYDDAHPPITNTQSLFRKDEYDQALDGTVLSDELRRLGAASDEYTVKKEIDPASAEHCLDYDVKVMVTTIVTRVFTKKQKG